MSQSQQDNGRVISKIKKLLAMAADTSSPHEASIAAEQARKLMDKHQLNYDDIEFHDDDFAAVKSGKAGYRFPIWKQTISVAVAQLNDCNALFEVEPDKRKVFVFQGFAADVELCNYLLTYLVAAAESQCKAFFAQRGSLDSSLKHNWLIGFSLAISKRMEEMVKERARIKTSSGRDLVVVKGALVKQHFGAVRYGEKKIQTDASDPEALAALRAGKRAGEKASIHQAVTHRGETQQALSFGGRL